MKRSICLYLHAHQPYRVKPYSIFDVSNDHSYFTDKTPDADTNNRYIIDKVAEKSYLPTNQLLLELLKKHPEFKLSLSITGTLIEQLEQWRPDVLDSFKRLVATGNVEVLGETYYHSLAFFYSQQEFELQVKKHKEKVQHVFGLTPTAFRNTELAYNNDLALWAEKSGYKAILAEGWDLALGRRSPNFVYKPSSAQNISLLTKNYKLSDDIAFRFSDKSWSEWPLTAEKFVSWVNDIPQDEPILNLFLDYETFGEHQWQETGIFKFLSHLPALFSKPDSKRDFLTVTEMAKTHKAQDELDVPQTTTWADSERDLSAWTGNAMQRQALRAIYDLQDKIVRSNDKHLIEDWRKLQTSDHYYFMSTKQFGDGEVHAYFSPYESPYEAYIGFMNVYHDLNDRLLSKGIEV